MGKDGIRFWNRSSFLESVRDRVKEQDLPMAAAVRLKHTSTTQTILIDSARKQSNRVDLIPMITGKPGMKRLGQKLGLKGPPIERRQRR